MPKHEELNISAEFKKAGLTDRQIRKQVLLYRKVLEDIRRMEDHLNSIPYETD